MPRNSAPLDSDSPTSSVRFCEAARGGGGIFVRDFACTDARLTLRHVRSMTANGEQPGVRFWYNPPAFSWASHPMAEVTGVPFTSRVDSLLLRPSGMRNAARTHRRLPLPAKLAPDASPNWSPQKPPYGQPPRHLDASGLAVLAAHCRTGM